MTMIEGSTAPSDFDPTSAIISGLSNANTDPSALSRPTTVRRSAALAVAHPWMDPQLNVALSHSNLSDPELADTAVMLQGMQIKTWSGFSHMFDDPVLEKEQSPLLGLRRYLTQAIGPWPVAEPHLTETQQNLQNQGFGRDLPVDGAWSPEWNAAFQGYSQKVVNDQLAGKQPGGVTFGSAVHMLTAVLPKAAGNAIIGFVKSIPGDVRDLMADAVAGTVDIGAQAYRLTGQSSPEQARRSMIGAGSNVERWLGNHQTNLQYAQQALGAQDVSGNKAGTLHIMGRLVQDIGTLFLVDGLFKAGASIGAAAGEEAARGVSDEAAKRGPGVIVKTLGRGAGIAGETAARRAVVGGVAGGLAGGGIAASQGASAGTIGEAALGGAAGGAALGVTMGYENIPVLGNVGPWVGRLASEDGMYYRARTLLATPYKYPAVRIAGDVAGKVGLEGAKIRGVAAVSGVLADAGRPTLPTTGLLVPGNIDLNDRPNIQNPDGSVSTVRSISIDVDDKEVLIPTVRKGLNRIMTNDEATAWYRRTGENLGTFTSPETADVYAEALHEQQARGPAGTNLSRAVQGSHVLDPVSDRIAAVEARVPIARSIFKGGLDDLVFMLHPGEGAISGTVGRQVGGVHEGATEALGSVGAIGQIEHATGKSWDTLVKEAGGEPQAERFWTNKVVMHAAYSHAEEEMAKLSPAESAGLNTSVARIDKLRAFTQEAYSDPEVLKGSLDKLLNTHFGEGSSLENRIRREITNTELAPDNVHAHDAKTYMRAVDLMREKVIPNEDGILHDLQLKKMQAQAAPAASDLSGDVGAMNGPPTAAPTSTQLGIARTQSMTSNQAARELANYRDLYDTAAQTGNSDNALAVERSLNDWLWMHGQIDAYRLPHDFRGKIALAQDLGSRMAGDVFATSPETKAAFAQLADLGYKPVVGTDIGHIFRDVIDNPVLDGKLSAQRKIVEKVGLAPDVITNQSIGTARSLGIRREVQALIDSRKITLPPHYTADTVIADVRKYINGEIPEVVKGGSVERSAQSLMRWEADRALQLRDVPRQVVVDALTRSHAIPDATAEAMRAAEVGIDGVERAPDSLPLFTEDQANRIYRAFAKGSAAPPAYMLGASKIEDLARASFGMAGDKLPGEFGDRIANLPNAMTTFRNRLRFELSPYFSFRRIAKTNAKLSLEGVAPVFSPIKALLTSGEADQAYSTLDRILPKFGRNGPLADAINAGDDAERYMAENDVFNLYNHRAYEAYAANEWAKAGKSDDEIKGLLTKVFGYGSAKFGEGRSSLERTTNFFFFPFSFDKTLYRNVGGYLLDHPGQAVVLDRALRGYKEFNDQHLDGGNPLAASWYEKHFPVLQEALRLNAFAHGLSAGEFGGINRPLLNMFLPQSWATSSSSTDTLKRFVPAVKDFQRVYTELHDQGDIAYWGARNGIDAAMRDLDNNPRNPLNPRPAAMTPSAQQEAAFSLRMDFDKQMGDALAYNQAHSSADAKIKFPNDPIYEKMGIAGKPVTRTNIGVIVQRFYPAYDPDYGAVFAAKAEGQYRRFLTDYAGTDKYETYGTFIDQAKKAAAHLRDSDYETSQAASLTQSFRDAASQYAADDPKFFDLYNKHFRYVFGPLEGVR